MSSQQSIRLNTQGDIAWIEFDLVGEKVNKLSTPVMLRLKEVLEEVKNSSAKVVVFISKKNKIFIAGADIEEIKKFTTKEEFQQAVGNGQHIFNMIEDLPQITIAAVHGACAGGGC